MTLVFKFIHQLTDDQVDELYEIVSNKDNMKELGNGKKWTMSKLQEIIKYSKEDYNNEFNNSTYLYRVPLLDEKVIGIGYIHPGLQEYRKCCTQVALLIVNKYRGNKYGLKLKEDLINMNESFIHKPLISIVKIHNKESNKVHKTHKLLGQLLFGNYKYNIYLLN